VWRLDLSADLSVPRWKRLTVAEGEARGLEWWTNHPTLSRIVVRDCRNNKSELLVMACFESADLHLLWLFPQCILFCLTRLAQCLELLLSTRNHQGHTHATPLHAQQTTGQSGTILVSQESCGFFPRHGGKQDIEGHEKCSKATTT